MKLATLVDLISSIVYGYYYTPILYSLPFIIFGVYGIWYFEYYPIKIYELYIMACIGLRIYASASIEYIWVKACFLTLIPLEYWTLYCCWIFTWYIRLLDPSDLLLVKHGWRPVDLW